MQKLLLINSALNTGSTGRIAEQTGILAKQQGWDVYIAHGARYTKSSALKTIRVVSKSEEILHAIQSMTFDAHGLGSRKATKKLVEKIKEIKPDIIHLHNIHGYYINYKILFEYITSLDIPIVWTLHDCWTMTGHCAHFDAIGCEKWKTGCCSCTLEREYPKSIFFDRSAYNYELKKRLFSSMKNATIIPVSKWLEGIVKESYLKNYTINVINNGIDIDIFKPSSTKKLREDLNIGNRFVLLAVAAQWNEKKGLYDCIKLSQKLSDEYCIIMIGLEKEQIKELPSNIIAIERTENQAQLAEFYSMADVLVNPTYNDTFPTVNLEAQACGTPVVTYRTGGSPESLSEETGIVVEKGNFEQLIQAIETIKKNGKQHYSAACRERAVNFYNKDDRFKEYIELYNSLIMRNIPL